MSFSSNAGEPAEIVLLPGMDGSGEFFRLLVEHLGSGLTPRIASYPETEPLGYEGLFPIVKSLIPEDKPFFILGESFSGPLAVMAAAENPPNLKGVILVATFVKSPVPALFSRFKGFITGPILDLRPREFLIRSAMGKDCPDSTLQWVREKLPRLPRKVLAARIRAVLDVNVREQLKKSAAPLLYIAAARDWVVGRKALDVIWLCRPDVQVRVLDGPHPILQVRPRESAQVIREFCARQGNAG